MHSSTSSFEREVPQKQYKKKFLIAFAIVISTVVLWEAYVRSAGYSPVINDNAELWVFERNKLDKKPDSDVVIGASRILFGLDLDQYEAAFNTKPIQLSTIGVNPTVYLEHLAEDPHFSGKVLVGYSPGLYFAGGGGPVQTPKDNIRTYNDMTWSESINFRLAKIFDTRLAFIQPDDLTLGSLLDRIPVDNRPGTLIPPELPPYFYYVDERRQGALGSRAEKDVEFAERIIDIWLGLMAPHDTHLPEDVREKNRLANIKDVIDRSITAVDNIRKKGGDVIFIRYPSTGAVRDLENELNPRDEYWDRLVSKTRTHSIHFEDYDSLKHFHCPEGGHLSRADRGNFTRALIPLLTDIYASIDESRSVQFAVEKIN